MTKKSATSIPGIYTITNSITGTVYVGQAVNIRRRWESHRHYLAANKHRNCYLQRAWNKYGADAFVFAIHTSFPNVPKTDIASALNAEEIKVLSLFSDTYNLMEAGISAPIAGPETRAIWSKQRKAMWADPEFRAKRSEETKRLYENATWKANRDAAVAAALSTPESKTAASERFSRMWQDESHRAAQSAKRSANWQDPEYRAKQKASRLAAAADPEVRRKRREGLIAAHARRKAAKLASTS